MINSSINKKYWAFISYSSKDNKWGKWLHKKLENYSIPKEFQGNELADGVMIGKNLRPVFRDRDELAGSAELTEAIDKALSESRHLIVLCSKNSANSEWVNKELEDFKALDPANEKRILAIILDGEPNATTSKIHAECEECFPPALRYPVEPLAGDLRKEGDGKERGFLKILAGVSQLDFDTLYRRHERAQKKKQLILGSMAATLILLLTGLTAMSVYFGIEARSKEKQAIASAISEKKAKKVALEGAEAEREAKEAAEELLIEVRANLMFLNYDLTDTLKQYVPLKSREDILDQVNRLIEISKKTYNSGSGHHSERLQQEMAYLVNRLDQMLASDGSDLGQAKRFSIRALEIAKTLASSEPENPLYMQHLAVCHEKTGTIFSLKGNGEDAYKHLTEATSIANRLVNKGTADYRLHLHLSALLQKVAALNIEKGDLKSARSHNEKAVSICRDLLHQYSGNYEIRHNTSYALNNLANYYLVIGDITSAKKAFVEAIEIIRKMSNAAPSNKQLIQQAATTNSNIGICCGRMGQPLSQIKHHLKAVVLFRSLVNKDPSNGDYCLLLTQALNNTAGAKLAISRNAKQAEAAHKLYTESIGIVQNLASNNDARSDIKMLLCKTNIEMGDCLQILGGYDKAQKHYNTALSISNELGSDYPDQISLNSTISNVYGRQGDVYKKLGYVDAAINSYKASLSHAKEWLATSPDNSTLIDDLSIAAYALARTYAELGKHELATTAYNYSITTDKKIATRYPNDVERQKRLATSNYELAVVYRNMNNIHKVKQHLLITRDLLLSLRTKNKLNTDSLKMLNIIEKTIQEVNGLSE